MIRLLSLLFLLVLLCGLHFSGRSILSIHALDRIAETGGASVLLKQQASSQEVYLDSVVPVTKPTFMQDESKEEQKEFSAQTRIGYLLLRGF